MRQFFAQNLAFMAIIASIMAATPAWAKNNAFSEVAEIATLHCQLWQRQLKHYEPAISPEDFRQILGRNLAEEDAEMLYASTFGIADFSFLLGDWQAVATRTQRQQFNLAMSQTLAVYWQQVPTPQEATCLMEVNLTARPVPEGAELPAPRLMLAEIHTSLLGVPLTYLLEQELAGWDITNIRIGAVDLQKKYAGYLRKILRKEGFEGVLRHPLKKQG